MTFDAVLSEVEARALQARVYFESRDWERAGDREGHAAAMARLSALESLLKWMLEELDRSLCEQAKRQNEN
jgi:hypothetical protein